MPTIPLHSPRPIELADAWHQVRSPGGYEWWYFDAEDIAQDIQIVAILFEGFVFHPGYLRAYDRYRYRLTRHAPPIPSQFPCAYLVVYEKGRLISQLMSQYPAEEFCASADFPSVQIGPNQFRTEEGLLRVQMMGIPWHLTLFGPKRSPDEQLKVDLRFTPEFNHSPHERTFLSQRLSGTEHHWVIANPLCQVEGHIEMPDRPPIQFRGRGYHDHNYGLGPLGPGLRRWMWGRVLLEDAAVMFHFAVPQAPGSSPESHLVEANRDGIEETASVLAHMDWSRHTDLGLQYPDRARFGDRLELCKPRLIDAQPFYLRLMYEARSAGRSGSAFCEVAYPNRLKWPIVGRMIEMAIEKQNGSMNSARPIQEPIV